MSNVKPGDLAYVISSGVKTPGIAGRIVEVVSEAVPGDEVECDGNHILILEVRNSSKVWLVRSNSKLPSLDEDGSIFYSKERFLIDDVLRPIRDNDGEDEMLKIIGRPKVLEKVE